MIKRAMLFILIFIKSVSFLIAFSTEETICSNGKLLSVSPDDKYAVTFQNCQKSIDSDYAEGWVYLHDLVNNSKRLLSKEKEVFEFEKAIWLDSNNLFLSDGGKISRINIIENTEETILIAENSFIRDFSISKDGKKVLYNVKDKSQDQRYQIVYLLDTQNNQKEEIYRIADPDIGGGFDVNYSFFVSDPQIIYIINIQKDLIRVSLKNKTVEIIDPDIALNSHQIVFLGNLLFYAKEKEIAAYSIVDGSIFRAVKSDKEKLRIDYMGKSDEGYVYFAFSDIVIFFNYNNKISERIDLPINGPIVYCSDRIAIQSNEITKSNERFFSLKLFKFSKKPWDKSLRSE